MGGGGLPTEAWPSAVQGLNEQGLRKRGIRPASGKDTTGLGGHCHGEKFTSF